MSTQNTVPLAMEDKSVTASSALRDRYKSPPPPPSSMTPPPSSQAPATTLSRSRTITPPPTHLSSPPLTIKPLATIASSINFVKTDSATGMYSSEQIVNATAEDLRHMLTDTMVAYREARASAAHHNLQYTLLCMESSEAIKRMEVEIEMKQKEVDVLQAARKSSVALPTPKISNQSMPRSASPNDRIVLDLKNACQLLEIENDNLRRRLDDAKAALIDREDSLLEENDRLRERIRENRNHMTLIRRANGSPETPALAMLNTPFITPAQTSTRPLRRAHSHQQIPSTPNQNHGDQFAALLLADRVLSQEEVGTPTRTGKGTRSRNQAGVVPTTPINKMYAPYFVGTPQKQSHPLSPSMALHTPTPRANQHRRRESRDSTISASDLEEQQRETEIDESRAEQEILRSRRANAIPHTPTPTKTPASARLSTSAHRITPTSGHSDKLKRKYADVTATAKTPKRSRLEEGVGLGILA